MEGIKYDIVSKIKKVKRNEDWNLELNIVSWNGNEPKYDIRCWNKDHTSMTRGVSLNEEEMRLLRDAYERFKRDYEGSSLESDIFNTSVKEIPYSLSTDEIACRIRRYLGTLSTREGGWNKELNICSWNSGSNVFDIRNWDSAHARMGRGLTLGEDEMRKLIAAYEKYENAKENVLEAS